MACETIPSMDSMDLDAPCLWAWPGQSAKKTFSLKVATGAFALSVDLANGRSKYSAFPRTEGTKAKDLFEYRNMLDGPPIKVKDMKDYFSWPAHNFKQLTAKMVPDATGVMRWGSKTGPFMNGKCASEVFSNSVSGRTISFSYAGVDAPGTSLTMSCLTAQGMGFGAKKPRVVRAIECDQGCQLELRNHPSEIEAIFGELDAFWIPAVKNTIRALQAANKSVPLESFIPLVHSGEAIVMEGWDILSGSLKPLLKSDIEVAGISCKPFSPIGKHDGDKSYEMSAMAAWACIMWKTEPRSIVVEESSLFDVGLLQKLLGNKYIWECCVLDGLSFGMPIRRKRFVQSFLKSSVPPCPLVLGSVAFGPGEHHIAPQPRPSSHLLFFWPGPCSGKLVPSWLQ